MPKSHDTAIICRVYVDEQYRGMGLANMLIENAESIAKQSGAKFTVARILNVNSASLRAFEKKGYKIDNSSADDLLDMRVYVIKQL